jgi:hypothetical protein
MRQAAYAFAQHLMPSRGSFVDAFDAFELATMCNKTRPADEGRSDWALTAATITASEAVASSLSVYHVDANSGSDTNAGTSAKPFATVEKGVLACRGKLGNTVHARDVSTTLASQCSVMVHTGTYYLTNTLSLTTHDSGLSIIGVPSASGELPTISGGVPLTDLAWAPAGGSSKKGVMKTKVPAGTSFTQLFVEGERAVRARHPNANPGGYFRTGRYSTPTGYFAQAKGWTRSPNKKASRTVHQPGVRNTTRYSSFILGFDGPVSEFDPPAAYWAVEKPPAGGGCKYEVPVAVIYNDDSDFVAGGAVPPSTWTSNVTGAVVHAFHRAYWGDWKFEVSSQDKTSGSLNFSRGGFQEARGSCGRGGHDWMVENVKELLDVPTEWWLDTNAQELYYFPNASAADTAGAADIAGAAYTAGAADTASSTAATTSFVASRLATLISINGTMEAPVTGVAITGLRLAHAAPTFMAKYEVPSAGDWSIHRGGAVVVEGAENVNVSNNFFDQSGGNGIAVSRYTRNVRISNNEMHRIGDTGVLVVGDLKYETAKPWEHLDGNYPTNTIVSGNLIHELGVFTKQTAGFFQALAVNTTVSGNVIFNGPRSGVNFNDAAFGGNVIEKNLLANLVRETVDHGPYNSWDRNPYTFAVGNDPTPTSIPLVSEVRYNFLYCSYGGVKGIDHDDGSGWYNDHHNFMPLCSGKMKGQAQTLSNNVYLYPNWGPQCMHMMGGMNPAGEPMYFVNNTCIAKSAEIYSSCTTDMSGKGQVLRNNTYFVPGYGTNPKVTNGFPCSKGNWTDWVKTGEDVGSTISGDVPSVEVMAGWGKDLLGF